MLKKLTIVLLALKAIDSRDLVRFAVQWMLRALGSDDISDEVLLTVVG